MSVTHAVEKAYALDTKYGNTIWRDDREISNLRVAFDILDTDCNHPPGWSKARGHIVFDVRIILEQKS